MNKILKTCWFHIRRTPYQSFAAIATISLVLFAIALTIIFAAGFERVIDYFESKPQITVFLTDTATEEEIDLLKLDLQKTGQIDKLDFVSKEDALKIYQEINKDNPLLLEMVTASILPASLEVSPKEIGALTEISAVLNDREIVEEISYQEDIVSVLQKWTRGIRTVGLVLVALLTLFSLLIIVIIMGMKIALRKMEIGVMKLIGAAPSYITNPFLFEGLIYGVAGAFLAWIASYTVILYSTPFLVDFLSGIPLLPVPLLFMGFLLLGLLGAGILIGGLGALFAVRRYLN